MLKSSDLRNWSRRKHATRKWAGPRLGTKPLTLVMKTVNSADGKSHEQGYWCSEEYAGRRLEEEANRLIDAKMRAAKDPTSVKPEELKAQVRRPSAEEEKSVMAERRDRGLSAVPIGRTWKNSDPPFNFKTDQSIFEKTPDGKPKWKIEGTGSNQTFTPIDPAKIIELEESNKKVLDYCKLVPDEPLAVFTAGPTASGKTGALNRIFSPHGATKLGERFVLCDSDNRKEHLQLYQKMADEDQQIGYSDPNAAFAVHEESAYMAKKLVADAISQGKNFVYDGTAKSPKTYEDFLQKVAAANVERVAKGQKPYKTVLVICDVQDVRDLKFRAQERAERTGRLVPDEPVDVIQDTYDKVPKTISKLQAAYDEVRLFDTSLPDAREIYKRNRSNPPEVGEATKPVLEAYLKRSGAWAPPQVKAEEPPRAHALRAWAQRKFVNREELPDQVGISSEADTATEDFFAMFTKAMKESRDALAKAPAVFGPGEGIFYPEDKDGGFK